MVLGRPGLLAYSAGLQISLTLTPKRQGLPMGLYVRKPIYQKLHKRIIFIILIVSLIPLVFLGVTIYNRFAKVYKGKIEDQIKYRALSQCDALEVFLKERTAILSTIADTHSFEDLQKSEHLARIFNAIRQRTDGLIDLGIIDSNGRHLAYAGPYSLEGLNYSQQTWFGEVMRKGTYISDVYMGYRRLPHFIIAVRGYDNSRSWAIRATIDPDVFNRLVRIAQAGRTGDAYIVNKSGVYQTAPRFLGKILEASRLNTTLFGEGVTVAEHVVENGELRYIAGAWLKNREWLLVISQEVARDIDELIAVRNTEIAIILFGCAVIILTTIFSTRVLIKRLEASDRGVSELNAQLIQADKMAALGKMAAGIAHEVNNPLAVIGEKAGWMRDLLAEETFQKSENFKEFIKSIDKIEEFVERARKITHSMLGFARRMEPHLDDVDVNMVLSQTIDLLEIHAKNNNIEIIKDLQPGLPIIASDQSQLQQIFMNLINNAVDAIGKDGNIELKTWKSNASIAISIKDNGPGIPEEYRNRIYDPFFTTKDPGKGTGLGLSITYSIIEKLGGTITLDTKALEGTLFVVTLPITVPGKK
jgi:two-component system, NtrC family, sensor kinase